MLPAVQKSYHTFQNRYRMLRNWSLTCADLWLLFSPLYDSAGFNYLQFFIKIGRGMLLIRMVDLNLRTTLLIKNNLPVSHILCILTIFRMQLLWVLCKSTLCNYIKRGNDEDSCTRKWLRKYTYTWYTAQNQIKTFKLKIEKCMSVSFIAKQLDIHICAIQRWVKQYEECLDSILTGRKKAADVFWVRNTKRRCQFYWC